MARLLVVDDEIEICEFLKAFFEEHNYTVATAHSGDAALAIVAQEQPQVVLLDIKMPGRDGMQVLRILKEQYPATKVIMVTAHETAEVVQEAARLGADNYITKPLSLDYLEGAVKSKIAQLI